MPALHVRDVPEPVLTALRERAARNGRSMQKELRAILEDVAARAPARPESVDPVPLIMVRTESDSTWSREEIYGDTAR